MVDKQFKLCTFFAEENVVRSVEFREEGSILFHFHVRYEGFLHVDFRPPEDQRISVQLILEERAKAMVRVLYQGQKKATFTCHTLQKHIGNNSQSTVEVRCVCEDEARVNYFGKIEIPENISAVKAFQRNKNLVFSENVYIHTEPAMDVRSKDAECFHGAAIGGIDPEILQYFSLRGIKRSRAQDLFIAGFLS
ncbi:MAG: SufD family Fe-S cluster assembly protein [Puniceicoccales bacterium]|jgi:Fe-S cluster assembly scaffold protein SufB|nr:SufD family Fe-S cluster assembly protein [Puniceicoccales bacterium]